MVLEYINQQLFLNTNLWLMNIYYLKKVFTHGGHKCAFFSKRKESNHSFVGGIQTADAIFRPSATKMATSSDEINIQSLTDSWNIFLYNMTLY